VQSRVDPAIKREADTILAGLGLDGPTAVRMFYAAIVNHEGIPFDVRQPRFNRETEEAIQDALHRRNLRGPFATPAEALAAALKD
jgi:DNA-damage-inducible protein J